MFSETRFGNEEEIKKILDSGVSEKTIKKIESIDEEYRRPIVPENSKKEEDWQKLRRQVAEDPEKLKQENALKEKLASKTDSEVVEKLKEEREERERKMKNINSERRSEDIKKEAYNDYAKIFSEEMEKLLDEFSKVETPKEKKDKIKDYLRSSEITEEFNMLLVNEDISEEQGQNLLRTKQRIKEAVGNQQF